MRLSTLFMVVFFLGLLGIGFMHEQVHVAIYRSYGISSHVEYWGHSGSWATISEEHCPTDMCNFANNLNEIIGYPLVVLYIVFGFYLCIIIGLKEEEIKW